MKEQIVSAFHGTKENKKYKVINMKLSQYLLIIYNNHKTRCPF